jgi:hypothetical protein
MRPQPVKPNPEQAIDRESPIRPGRWRRGTASWRRSATTSSSISARLRNRQASQEKSAEVIARMPVTLRLLVKTLAFSSPWGFSAATGDRKPPLRGLSPALSRIPFSDPERRPPCENSRRFGLLVTHRGDLYAGHPAFRQANLLCRRRRQIETPAPYRRTTVVDFDLGRTAVFQVSHS